MEARGEGGVDFADEVFGGHPVDAAVGNAHTVAEIFLGLGEGLAAGAEVTLDHRAHQGAITGGDLREEDAHDLGLELGFFGGIIVRAIDEDGLGQASFGEEGLGLGEVGGRVVGAGGAAAEDDVAMGITAGDDGGGGAVEVDTEESLRLAGGFDGVDGGLERAISAVLKTNGHRETGRHLTMRLRLGGAGTNGAPANEIGDVLRGDGIEELRGGGQAEIENIAQETAAETEAGGDVVRAVEMRIHHESLPTNGGAGLLKIHAHNNEHAVGDFLGEGGEAAGIVAAGVEVVDRAGPDQKEETLIIGKNDAVDVIAAVGDEGGLRSGLGQLGKESRGRGQGASFDDVEVGGAMHETAGCRAGCHWRKPGVGQREPWDLGKKVAGYIPLCSRPLLS